MAAYFAKVYSRAPDRCFSWLGALSSSGHGRLRMSRKLGSRVVASRVLRWQLSRRLLRPVPGGLPPSDTAAISWPATTRLTGCLAPRPTPASVSHPGQLLLGQPARLPGQPQTRADSGPVRVTLALVPRARHSPSEN